MINLFKIFTLLITISLSLQANYTLPDWLFKDPDFGKPLVSEIGSTLFKVELGNDKDFEEYNMRHNTDELLIMSLDFGYDIPILSFNFGTRNQFGLALTLPVSTNIYVDMFEPKTAPLINQDYKFGAPKLAFIYRYSDSGWFRNISFNLLPMLHECSHIGDEITIHRTNVDLPIIRINISYEFSEFSLTVNDPENTRDNLHTLKVGGIYRLTDEGYGWFKIDQKADIQQPVDIPHSNERFEYYINYQYQNSSWFFTSKDIVGIFAIEARNRLVYNHPTFRKDDNGDWIQRDKEERLKWSFNSYFGWYFYPDKDSTKRIGLFFRQYLGVAPYGQLRNYGKYVFLGWSLTYNP